MAAAIRKTARDEDSAILRRFSGLIARALSQPMFNEIFPAIRLFVLCGAKLEWRHDAEMLVLSVLWRRIADDLCVSLRRSTSLPLGGIEDYADGGALFVPRTAGI